MNGDGFNDIIIGANYGDSGGNRSGDTFIVFGGPTTAGPNQPAPLSTWDALDGTTDGKLDVDFLDGSNGFRLQGVDAEDQSGVSVTAIGDINFDGLTDLLVGAPRANSLAGESYVIFGRLPDASVTRWGTDQGQNLVGGDFQDFLEGLGGDDVLYGHGGNDGLTGGTGDDVLLGDDGDDQLSGGDGDDAYVGGDGTDRAIFEQAAAGVTVDLLITTAQSTGQGNDTLSSIEEVCRAA